MSLEPKLNQPVAKKPITKRFQRFALIGYIGLLILMPVWLFLIAPREGHSNGFIFVVYILPLLLPLKGIMDEELRDCVEIAASLYLNRLK